MKEERLLDSSPTIHVEVRQSNKSTLPPRNVEFLVDQMIKKMENLYGDCILTDFEPELAQHVESVSICDVDENLSNGKFVSLLASQLHYHVYRLVDDEPSTEEIDDEDLSAASHWILPSREFHGLWESLIYDDEVKSQLLNFVSTTLLFSDRNVDSNVVSWNGVILLHGPPGTGKTSLCKALAQKLSVRLGSRYSYGQLIEINSHSLFSKWFSESGKLVMKMFCKIRELIDDREALVFVLIDEVESLAHSRNSSAGGADPSDAVRAVNALLTQLDNIRRYPNVIILTTSNITGAIDLAFVDRADVKQYVGPPSAPAIYHIYRSCILELQNVEIIVPKCIVLPLRQLNITSEIGENSFIGYSLRVKELAKKSEGLSGRTLRRLPFLAHALFIQKPTTNLDNYLDALSKAIDKEFQDRSKLQNNF
ncbi:pachytene checkpoint protein 2 homolog [Centruroides sculpturatus]|uniref:pachytene checkpoint protein 2 homolog n=1 Tax=Centruroides sculpturatus TaxID=218467 RepID=UPI000C6C8D69|nr:pachytene checkpoint protein 2 homolog [Centruroides sculpturatus]